jgi:hypothetical protein
VRRFQTHLLNQIPRGPRRRQGSTSIKASGLCVSCGGTRSSQFHPAPQEWSDFYHCVQNVSPSSKKKTMRLCHSCYGSISKQFSCSALERVGPNNNNYINIAVVDVAANNVCRRSNKFPAVPIKDSFGILEDTVSTVLMFRYAGTRGYSRNKERLPSFPSIDDAQRCKSPLPHMLSSTSHTLFGSRVTGT